MIVKHATDSDKDQVLDFCTKTFSWGDYIANVWDYWKEEGNLLVVHQNNSPVAVCHVSIFTQTNQVWIEGIRVNSNFRRKGYATHLVREAENISKKSNCLIAYMLIESTNTASLELAKKLKYENFETWNFYSLTPKKIDSKIDIKFVSNVKKLPTILSSQNLFYVKSWRWFPLNNSSVSNLAQENRIIYFRDKNGIDSLAVITDSEHFDNTMLVTVISGSIIGLKEIFTYVQNLSYQKNSKRIQILTKLKTLPNYNSLENRLTFYLMKKNI